MKNYAKFESNSDISEVRNEAIYSDPLYGSNGEGIINSIFGFIGDLFIGIFTVIVIFISVFIIFFLIYIIISLFSKGGEKTLSEIKKFSLWIGKILSKIFGDFFKKLKKLPLFFLNNKKKLIFLVLFLFLINFGNNVINGSSKILRLDKIKSGYVGVDLKNNKILKPGYHLYLPIKTSYFLSPTSNFDFEIAEITANTKEELSVALDYRVGFKLINEERLDFYKTYGVKNIKLVSSDIVMPKLLEVIKGTIRKYGFKDISTKHNEIKKITLDEANKVLINLGIKVQDLTILDIRLPKSYLLSKEDLLKSENELKLAEAKLETQRKESEKKIIEAQNSKKVKIIEAEAVAEYNKIINNVEMNDKSIEIKKLEIERKKVEKWNGQLPNNIGGNFDL